MRRTTEGEGIAEEAYGLVKTKAWSFYVTTGVPKDELESEGLLVYTQCLYSFKPELGVKFTTYLYNMLTLRLGDFCKEWGKQLPAMLWDGDKMPDVISRQNTEADMMYRQWLSELSPQAREVAKVLEDRADDIVKQSGCKVKDPHAPKHIKGALKRFLMEELGWKPFAIEKAFKELAEAM